MLAKKKKLDNSKVFETKSEIYSKLLTVVNRFIHWMTFIANKIYILDDISETSSHVLYFYAFKGCLKDLLFCILEHLGNI